MAQVATYLNFSRNTEEAFMFYRTVFGGEFGREGIARLGDAPVPEGMPPIAESDRNLVMHVELPILGGHLLMGTDAPESMGFALTQGNTIYIMLDPDSREQTESLFDKLSDGGHILMELQDMFWGSYYGTCVDKYGVQWMFNFTKKN